MDYCRSSAGLILWVALLGAGVFLSGERAIGQSAQFITTSQPHQSITQAKSYFRQAEFKQAIVLYNKILINPSSENSTKIKALLGLSEIDLWDNLNQLAEEKLNQALKLCRQTNDRAHEAEVLAALGWFARNQQNYPKALELLNQSLTIAQHTKNSKAEARSQLLLGSVFYVQAQCPRALKALQVALKTAESHNDQDEITHIYDWMGITYRELKDFKQAGESFQRQQVLSRSIGYRTGEIDGLRSIAATMNIQKKPEGAIQTYQQALEIAKAADNPWLVKAIAIEQGWLYVSQKQTEKAVEVYQKTLPFAVAIDESAVTDIQNRIGVAYSRNKQFPQALLAYQQALQTSQKTNDSSSTAQILANIGYTYKQQKLYQKSREAYQQALTLHQTLNNPSKQASILNEIGHSYLSESDAVKNDRKDYSQAQILSQQGRKFFQRQLEIAQNLPDRTQIFYAQISIGQSYDDEADTSTDIGKYSEALDFQQKGLVEKNKGLTIAEDLKDANNIDTAQYSIWASYRGLTNTYHFLNQNETALDYVEKARKIAKTLKKPELETNLLEAEKMIYVGLINLNENPRQYTKRLELCNKVVKLLKQLNDRDSEAQYLTLTALIYYFWGQYDRAWEMYTQVLSLARSSNANRTEITALQGMGLISQNRGDYSKSLDLFQQALKISRTHTVQNLEIIALNNIANTYTLKGQYRESLNYLQQTQTIVKSRYAVYKQGATNVAYALNSIGNLHRCLGEFQKAIDSHQQALTIAQTIGALPQEVETLSDLAADYREQGQLETARKLLQKSLEMTRSMGDRKTEGTILQNLGRLALQESQP